MSPEPYEVALNRSARRALAETLPLDVAVGMAEFITGPLGLGTWWAGGYLDPVGMAESITGPLGENPYRVGRELHAPASGVYSARVMRDWRVLYVVDEDRRLVAVRDIRHRRDAYRA